MNWRLLSAIPLSGALAAAGLFGPLPLDAAGPTPAAPGPIPTFTAEFLAEPENIDAGKQLWDDQCTHCHGRNAYPGKAPKLQPGKYTPEFVYDRVTWGFRKMPGWEEAYTEEERMKIVAYVLSRSFSP